MIELIPYIVLAMIFYDLSIHFVFLVGWSDWILERKINWWQRFIKIDYQVFWNVYWGIAFILMLMYVLFV